MSISIKEVKLRDWGPLEHFHEEMTDLVLIYGKNETGKTTLIEALLTALFKEKKHFQVREDDFKGNIEVQVAGIEKSLKSFKGSSKKKMDDFLKDEIKLMPLICVRGADASFDEDHFDNFFDQFLYPSKLLSSLNKKTPNYIRFEGSQVYFDKNMGLKKDLDSLEERLLKIEGLLEEVNDLSFYKLCELGREGEQIKKRLGELDQDKAYYKFKIQGTYKAKKGKFDLWDTTISELDSDYKRYLDKLSDKKNIQSEVEASEKNTEDLAWIREVKKSYESFFHKPRFKNQYVWFFSIGFILLGFIFGSWVNRIAGITCLAIGMLLLFFYRLQRPETFAEDERFQAIAKEFKDRYHKKIPSIEELNGMISEKEASREYLEKLKKDFALIDRDLVKIKDKIRDDFTTLDLSSEEGQWGKTLAHLKEDKKQLQTEIEDLNGELLLLEDLEPIDPKDKEANFSPKEEKKLQAELAENEMERMALTDNLSRLQFKIGSFLGIEEETELIDLVDLLREEQRTCMDEYRDTYFNSLSKGVLRRVIDNLEGKKRRIIEEEMNRPEFKELISEFTLGKYAGFTLESDSTYMSQKNGKKIPFSHLSNGAAEQISMAIRLGLSKRITDQNMFFILDDAMLHTDWDRRPKIIENLIDLTKSGWQIIYFTMDNYTRDLFLEKGKNNKNFKYIELK